MESKDEVSDTDSGIILQSGERSGSPMSGPSPGSLIPGAPPRAGQAELLRDWSGGWEGGRGLCWGQTLERLESFPSWRFDSFWNWYLQLWPQ